MKSYRYPTLILIGFLLIFAACTPAAKAPPDKLVDTRWRLVSFNQQGDDAVDTPVLPGTTVTLEFLEDQARGDGGCNTFRANYRVDGSQIAFQELVTTEIACANNGVMDQEQRYYDALMAAEGYEISADRLTIRYNGGENFLRFNKVEETQ
jgi:heat shock protein HslJ